LKIRKLHIIRKISENGYLSFFIESGGEEA
jgi:hypothetical protein